MGAVQVAGGRRGISRLHDSTALAAHRTGNCVGRQPRFDLSSFDPAYFHRLRDRVIAAGNKGIYISVMLFDGFCLTQCPPPDNVEGHPFAAGNNISGIGITSISDYQVLPLDPAVQALQEAYLHKVVDTVQDLPNVLYEVANESTNSTSEWGDSTQWQYWVIDSIKAYETRMGYERHPVGMTYQIGAFVEGPNGNPAQPPDAPRNTPLFESPADWISPGYEEEYYVDPWYTGPPASDGTKVVISDTDHYASGLGDALWAWKSFLRGHNSILMDFGIIDVVDPLDPALGLPSYESFEPARYAMERYPSTRRASGSDRHGAAWGSQLDRVCARRSRQPVRRPSAERGRQRPSRSQWRPAGTWRSGTASRPGTRDERALWRSKMKRQSASQLRLHRLGRRSWS